MSTCDNCRSPGSCCSAFVLSLRFRRDNWREDAVAEMEQRGIPHFVPVRPALSAAWFDGSDRIQVVFDCTRVGEDGRCQAYEERPEVCRIFEPGSDQLCSEFVMKLRGIPIVVTKPATEPAQSNLR